MPEGLCPGFFCVPGPGWHPWGTDTTHKATAKDTVRPQAHMPTCLAVACFAGKQSIFTISDQFVENASDQ